MVPPNTIYPYPREVYFHYNADLYKNQVAGKENYWDKPVTLNLGKAYPAIRKEVKEMLIRRLILTIGAILVITGILLIATGFPISIIGPVLIGAGLLLVLLSIFLDRKALGISSILIGVLVVIAAAAIFAILGAGQLTAYILLFLGVALIVLGLLLLFQRCQNEKRD